MMEFSSLAQIYSSIIVQNISRIYVDSIETHQKSEYNYTINYYYNILIKFVQSNHQFIINNLPTNKNAFNDILDQRKNDVNNLFTSIIQNFKNYQNDSLSFDSQIRVLQVSISNFFKINNILSDNIFNLNNSLTTKIRNLSGLTNKKANNEISLISKFYLEN